jgi:pimeloyl-ACP methyl ester carboxylesterase
MGGLAAANASSLRGDCDFRLLLIAPAFGLSGSWEGLTEEELSKWRRVGTRRYRGFELDIDLEWGFMEAAERMSWPEPLHRTTIVHGTKDDVVSIEVSRKVAREAALVDLVEIDDGHRMKECLHLLSGLASELMSRGA